MIKIDLHTHSQASSDGSLRLADYRKMLRGRLDYIAVTDHDTIDFALELRRELGEQIIVGEEITTQQGEIIGLYLQEAIPAGLSASEAVEHIRRQGGLVYIPHPFETVRHGLSTTAMESIAEVVDIIETYNGRSFQNRSARAADWAEQHMVPGAASSDAHGWHGWGNTYSSIADVPSVDALVGLLANATYNTTSTGIRGRLYPKLNRLRRRR